MKVWAQRLLLLLLASAAGASASYLWIGPPPAPTPCTTPASLQAHIDDLQRRLEQPESLTTPSPATSQR